MNSQFRVRNSNSRPAVPSHDEQVAQLVKTVAELRQALSSRETIGQAVGVLICLYQLSPDDGFAALRVTSQLANIKLHTIAQDVITWAHTHKPLAAPTKKALDEALRLLPRADGPTS